MIKSSPKLRPTFTKIRSKSQIHSERSVFWVRCSLIRCENPFPEKGFRQTMDKQQTYEKTMMRRSNSRCQFHQHFTSSFFIRKSFEQLFCTYSLGLYFFGARILAQKLLVKCWCNWPQKDKQNYSCKQGYLHYILDITSTQKPWI